jgi:hypothetical protein
MTMLKCEPKPPPQPPQKLWKHELCDILAWYEHNLCGVDLRDPRGKRVSFSSDRLPHLVKLLNKESGKEAKGAQKIVEAIRRGEKTNQDFGGYDAERAQTLTWIPLLIVEPTLILEVVERTIWEKPGDTLLVKEFNKHGYRHKVLVCRQVGDNLLVPITCHPRDHKKKFGKAYRVVWP